MLEIWPVNQRTISRSKSQDGKGRVSSDKTALSPSRRRIWAHVLVHGTKERLGEIWLRCLDHRGDPRQSSSTAGMKGSSSSSSEQPFACIAWPLAIRLPILIPPKSRTPSAHLSPDPCFAFRLRLRQPLASCLRLSLLPSCAAYSLLHHASRLTLRSSHLSPSLHPHLSTRASRSTSHCRPI
jgi:hypothetical protein